jgi:hypothetical protein
VALYQTLLRSPLLLNLFECFYHCFVLVGEQVVLFVIHTIIYKKSVETGQVPLDWNHANVTPVYKKADKHHPANYRPIYLILAWK